MKLIQNNLKVIYWIISLAGLLLALMLMDFNQGMSPYWIAPYLSAAANFDLNNPFIMNVNYDQIKQFSMLSTEQQFNYKFPSNTILINYDYLPIGFMYILLIAKKIFFFLGDLTAVQWLQYTTHIIIVYTTMQFFKKDYLKILFYLLYGLNPIVLYFVNYPFYYFWQVIPAFVFLWYFLSNKKLGYWIFALVGILAYMYFVRATVLFLVLFIFLLYGYRESWRSSILACISFLMLILIFPSHSQAPWHTMYVGIGAYKNPYNIQLADEEGYKFFYNQTGKKMNSTNINDPQLIDEYYQILKKEYFRILSENPKLAIKNALLNIFQSYSIGYKVGNEVIAYASAFLGFLMIVLLLYSKQYILFLAIGLLSSSFTPYYPPIAAYMYGSYILLVVAFINIIEYLLIYKHKVKRV